jgi:hypothetical protein
VLRQSDDAAAADQAARAYESSTTGSKEPDVERAAGRVAQRSSSIPRLIRAALVMRPYGSDERLDESSIRSFAATSCAAPSPISTSAVAARETEHVVGRQTELERSQRRRRADLASVP